MKEPGQVAVLSFPTTGLAMGKPRPVLLPAPLPGRHDDWLVSMISTQVQQAIDGFDEVIGPSDVDFEGTGLKMKNSSASSAHKPAQSVKPTAIKCSHGNCSLEAVK